MDNILIIDAGSIGTLIGVSLIKAGLTVTFAGKPESNYTKLIEKRGLRIICLRVSLDVSYLKSLFYRSS